MAENESPAREPSTRGRGRGGRGRGGRGRGGGRGGSTAAVSKAATAKVGRGGSRRGRAKNFADSRVQAAYERQRHLKANYQAVAHALKPALQELAERTIDEAFQNPDKHKHAQEFIPLMQELQDNLDAKIAEYTRRYNRDKELAEHLLKADHYVAQQEYLNGCADLTDQFYEGQDNRARILNSLYDKDLPVDVVDDQYEYKVISDEHFDEEFGLYVCRLDGNLVPYPSRVPGTAMWQKGRDNEVAATAAVSAPTTSAPASQVKSTRGRGRGANKRRAQDQLEGQPTPKKNTRSNPDDAAASHSLSAPAPAKGLLASAAEVEATPEGTPAESDSTPASPEPPAFVNGIAHAAVARAQNHRLQTREKSPPLPKNMGEADEYGFRMFNQKPSMREKGISSRLFVPRPFEFEKWEIGFRDSSNDSSKGHSRAKRGKYLDTPDSNGLYIDAWCNGFDFSNTKPSDFDKETVKRFGVHPKFGIILRDAPVPEAEKTPHVMPGKPVVYIANPSGRISHASRSFLKTINHRRVEDNPYRAKVGASMRRFCKLGDIDLDELDISEYVRSEDELRSNSLGTALKELEARPVVSREPSESEEPETEEQVIKVEDVITAQPEVGFTGISVLALASAFLEAEGHKKAPEPAPAPKPARYDAIRDVFTDSKPAPAPKPDTNPSVGLDILAALSDVAGTPNEPAPVEEPLPVYEAAEIEYAMGYEPAPMSETSHMIESIGVQEQPVYRDAMTNGMGPACISSHGIQEHDPRGSISRNNELPPVTPSQAPIDPRFNSNLVEVPQGYMHQPHAQLPMQSSGSVHGHPGEALPYPPIHDPNVPQHPSVRHSEYPPPPPSQGPPVQDQGTYLSHNSYPNPDHRDAHMASGRPIDPGYPPRRLSYAPEAPSYSRQYWSQPPPPPGPTIAASAPPGPASGSVPSHYSSPAPPSARIPFSHNGSAEPLPPLRPSRGRNQSLQDEALLEPSLRSPGSYYPPGPPRSYHRGGYHGPEPHGQPQLQPITTDRILPNPQTAGQSYMTSPHQGYAHQVLSPTYANPPPMPPHMAQSPQDNHQGLPSSVHRHRSTPSGSSDAGNKYRKLQPAPVPAHRSWPNKPELKTIPYDHKETGSVAALPSSGPTQIRGWSADGQTKPNKPFKSVRFAEPLFGDPAIVQKSNKRKRADLQTNKDHVESESPEETQAKKDEDVVIINTPVDLNKRQLRPRKPKTPQGNMTASAAEPPKKKPRVTAARKSAAVEPAKTAPKKTVIKIVRSNSSKKTIAKATGTTTKPNTASDKSSKDQESLVKEESSDDVQIIKSQRSVIVIDSTDESSK
ncbi:unnamed protein product [Fusarium graminearum]|uniref:Uncharacterized protein n=1 Tax=Gibberella zeae TaxID=5518 RepID=A0A2H3HB81_GIBZA|nr:hypothetical protein HG531_003005 [Fusarium graminearum]PCD40437.1 hypothetical protein FGRA07_01708 [Fusarium graminearum]CAF3464612.1 unnamed protein product [Fusarium graminearum]CAG1987238.1 unnamed protein product [Fusarium graminearum]CAG1999914.1 unnamed protein product [Fusarium graminearum]